MSISPQIWEHYKYPNGRGHLDDYSGEGWAGSRQGGMFMRIQLRLQNDIIQAAAFETLNCLSAIATGSFMVESISGKSLEQLNTIDPTFIDQGLGGLPRDKKQCADMAIHALKRALENAQQKGAAHDLDQASPPQS